MDIVPFFLLFGAIFIAPSLSKTAQRVLGVSFFVCALLFTFLELVSR